MTKMLKVNIEPLKLDKRYKAPALGWEAFCWPETIALLDRLGIDMSKPMKRIIVDLSVEEVVSVYVQYRGSDTNAQH